MTPIMDESQRRAAGMPFGMNDGTRTDIIVEINTDSLNDGTRNDISAVQRLSLKGYTIPQRQFDKPAAASFDRALREKHHRLPLESREHVEGYAFIYGQHFSERGPMNCQPIPLQPFISVEPPSKQQLRSLGINFTLSSRSDARFGQFSTAATDSRLIGNTPRQGKYPFQQQLPFALDLKSGSISRAAKREANSCAARKCRMRKQAKLVWREKLTNNAK